MSRIHTALKESAGSAHSPSASRKTSFLRWIRNSSPPNRTRYACGSENQQTGQRGGFFDQLIRKKASGNPIAANSVRTFRPRFLAETADGKHRYRFHRRCIHSISEKAQGCAAHHGSGLCHRNKRSFRFSAG